MNNEKNEKPYIAKKVSPHPTSHLRYLMITCTMHTSTRHILLILDILQPLPKQNLLLLLFTNFSPEQLRYPPASPYAPPLHVFSTPANYHEEKITQMQREGTRHSSRLHEVSFGTLSWCAVAITNTS
ncbi:hypothetical protein, unlikely [Trypanosoma brucei gambiense DAL972]|uniref:Uncharacterized protein n=1 Tax=Trypanosoma brucei gambiense (strain MHOM/CI/86/DAL972) TaxID=679716 RepID=D0A611_TRYB9|nr:hypothetical protein, unlikely [Trypanosoma brucei gambiense DAL972]CBH17112.1 hypothetical protein, unlikely [Trypanosoma brucei gambiense DAL972]|eukprot:XP_011779376.1 hypothetical protein, unlikely [Trypanosoma brucei gambiense DAL972]